MPGRARPDLNPTTGTPSQNTMAANSTVNNTPYATGAASNLWNATGTTFDVVADYKWTLSRNAQALEEVPYITLNEYIIDETTIKTQLSYYYTNVTEAATGQNTEDILAPYKNLFPRTPSGNIYRFPYFSDINFEVNTDMWKSLDTLEAGQRTAEGLAGVLFGEAGEQGAKAFFGAATKIGGAALAASYPKIGIMDRPKLWDSHQFRTVEIKFPLFNTVGPSDWKKNRNLCWMLVNQNLFTKRDFITGIPPVYYEVFIPGQHYSYAACVTNLTVYNRGNMRTLKEDSGNPALVPDVYEINITLTDMVMPSRNLFQAIQKQTSRVQVTQGRLTQINPTPAT